MGLGVGLAVGTGVGLGVGNGVAMGYGVAVGYGVDVGYAAAFGLGVGSGVAVGLRVGVSSSLAGGWPATVEGTEVGTVKTIPCGAAGDGGTSAEPPQATITSSVSAPAVSPIISATSLRPVFPFLTFRFLCIGNNLFCRTRSYTLQHYRADSTYLPLVGS